jgi:hypothetical protein
VTPEAAGPPGRDGGRGRRGGMVLIERQATSEPVAVELEPGGGRPRPVGFWRGRTFYRVLHIVERRKEIGTDYVRLVSDRGAFDLRQTLTVDPWTWRAERQWELVAVLTAVPLGRRM